MRNVGYLFPTLQCTRVRENIATAEKNPPVVKKEFIFSFTPARIRHKL